jgi:hypothetical protein
VRTQGTRVAAYGFTEETRVPDDKVSLLALLLALAAPACVAQVGGEEDEQGLEDGLEREMAAVRLRPGVNGDACAVSPYNCKLRVSGGNRVKKESGDIDWALDTGVPLRDGNGTVVGTSLRLSGAFNHGQTRVFGGAPHAFAVSSSNGSAAWLPLAAIHGHGSFAAKVGHVSAHGAGLADLGCYEIRNGHDASIELKKVVHDSETGPNGHERAGDYLPLVRANGKRSANLCFNVPGFALGGVAVDHFPAGTRFQRLDVPTSSGRPSIDIPLWVQDSAGRYRKRSGTMKFVYGHVMAATGTRRVGWMAYDALNKAASDCR